uniref:Uncharacterized protein n=1 Tax=Cacopsylla melanoneura TaxID=428564 RepID=A0A8D8T770_9HEMI
MRSLLGGSNGSTYSSSGSDSGNSGISCSLMTLARFFLNSFLVRCSYHSYALKRRKMLSSIVPSDMKSIFTRSERNRNGIQDNQKRSLDDHKRSLDDQAGV